MLACVMHIMTRVKRILYVGAVSSGGAAVAPKSGGASTMYRIDQSTVDADDEDDDADDIDDFLLL